MKKALAIVLSCVMLLGLVSVVSFADAYSKSVALISGLRDGRDQAQADPISANENGGATIEQPAGWLPWVMVYTDAAKAFTAGEGETLYLVYDFTVSAETTVQITLSGWRNSVSAAIAGDSASQTDEGAPTIPAGTYTGAVEIDPSWIGDNGRFGVAGTGAIIRTLKLASGKADAGTSTEPASTEPESTASAPTTLPETMDLITKITNGTDPSDPTVITDTGSGFQITQNPGWNVWVLHFSDDAALFGSRAGDDLILQYDMTIDGYGHLCTYEWSHSIAADIARCEGVDTVPAEDGTPMLPEGTYQGWIYVDSTFIGETGRLGIIGNGATIRTFRLAKARHDENSEDESSQEASDYARRVGKGDANADNSVDMKDVLLVRKYIAKLATDIDEWAADVNRDGNVDMKDVLIIRKFIANMIGDLDDPGFLVDDPSSDAPTDPSIPSGEPSQPSTEPSGEPSQEPYEGPIIGPDGSFLDNFNTGVDPDLWYISTQAWGGATNGCKAENVNYTASGELVLTAHGKLYQGNIGGRDGSRTGACLVTKNPLGPGSFEVRMKCLPRLGTCTAMWTYFNDGRRNHEIDIELPGNTNTFKYSLFTNWLTEEDYLSQNTIPGYYHSDGEWHTYRFDWHTDPARIDYYVDGKLEMTATAKIPTAAGRFWVGVWLPNAWCGEPDFETAHMLVDYVKYTPFNEPYETTGGTYRSAAAPDQYPKAPIALPVNNYVANGSFDNDVYAWTTSGGVSCVAGEDGKALSLNTASSTATQRISSMNAKGLYRFTADAKVASAGDTAVLKIEALAQNKSTVLDTQTITFNSTAFTTKSLDVTLPSGAAFVRITLSGSAGSVFDHLYLTQPSRGDF